MTMPYRSGAKVHTAVADVRDYDTLAKAMEETKETLGPVHTVCANPSGGRCSMRYLPRVDLDGLTWI
jgi:NADP-dependent 3-hydroxy acid dehydrogenase YdfG